METYVEALDLWEAVDEDYKVAELSSNLMVKGKEDEKNKGKSISFCSSFLDNIYQDSDSQNCKGVWDYLKKQYAENEIICGMQTMNLMREFELQRIQESETIKEYL